MQLAGALRGSLLVDGGSEKIIGVEGRLSRDEGEEISWLFLII